MCVREKLFVGGGVCGVLCKHYVGIYVVVGLACKPCGCARVSIFCVCVCVCVYTVRLDWGLPTARGLEGRSERVPSGQSDALMGSDSTVIHNVSLGNMPLWPTVQGVREVLLFHVNQENLRDGESSRGR